MSSIDIVIPNYNYGRFLEGCVQSVLARTYRKCVILIIDNASTDDSVVDRPVPRYGESPHRDELHPINLGGHASFNEGIDWARADYFAIVCAGRYAVARALARAIEALDDNPRRAYGVRPDRLSSVTTPR